MGSLGRILKNIFAFFTSHLLSVLTQLALTPFFIHRYGTAVYGEWLALSATVTILSNLDFGVQTFVNQDLTVRFQRGDMDSFHSVQSTALRILLGVFGVMAVAMLVVFALPLQHWLKMDGSMGAPAISQHEIALTLYLLALQVLGTIIWGYFTGQFMVIRRAHVGGYWSNAQRFVQIVVSITAVWLHVRFSTLAAVQLLSYMVMMAALIAYMYRVAPEIFPTLRYWDASSLGPMLSKSGHFALIFSTTFLVYQCPILILQRSVGPEVVTVFAVMRTIFSMARMVLSSLSQAIGPEITGFYARNEWESLRKLYNESERLVFSSVLIGNGGVLFLSPVLLALWIHKPGLFRPEAYVLAAAISLVISTKEHKYIFQFSTNTHELLARFMFGSYIVMVGAMVPLAHLYGINGILAAWLTTEIVQMAYLFRLNVALFHGVEQLSATYLYRLAGASVLLFAVAAVVMPHSSHWKYLPQTAATLAVMAALTGVSYAIFGLHHVLGTTVARIRRRAG